MSEELFVEKPLMVQLQAMGWQVSNRGHPKQKSINNRGHPKRVIVDTHHSYRKFMLDIHFYHHTM